MSQRPEFRHLRYFIAVAELCNIGRAAERLNVSQPALSEQIKQLEEIMGVSLFIRGRGGSALTPEGRTFLPFAKDLMSIREQAFQSTSSEHSGTKLPLRLGYSPFLNRQLVDDALNIFCELVPNGKIEPSSETTGRLLNMLLDGQIEAALVTLPVSPRDLYIKEVCEERVMVCLRKDDPLASLEFIPKAVIADRLRIFVERSHQPMFYDKIMRKFLKSGITLQPTEFVSAPSAMHFLVKRSRKMGLINESTVLPNELVLRGVEGISLKVTTALICLKNQQRPVLPILAFKLAERCEKALIAKGMRKPVRSAAASSEISESKLA